MLIVEIFMRRLINVISLFILISIAAYATCAEKKINMLIVMQGR